VFGLVADGHGLALPEPHRSRPLGASNPAFVPICNDLSALEATLTGVAAGSVAPSAAVPQVQSLARRLQADAQTLQQQGQGNVADLLRDLSIAADQLRTALQGGGNVLTDLGPSLTRFNNDIQQIPPNVCNVTPSPIST